MQNIANGGISYAFPSITYAATLKLQTIEAAFCPQNFSGSFYNAAGLLSGFSSFKNQST